MGILGSGSVHMSGRYAKKPVTGRLGAVNAVCQKCLQKGHWTYDCKASATVYQSRPSRTKQLMDPNYKPRFLGASELLPGDASKGKEGESAAKQDKKKRKKPASSTDDSDSSSSSDGSSSSSDDSSSSSDDSSSSSSSDSSSSDSSTGSDSSSSGSDASSSDSGSSSSDGSSSDSEEPPPKKKGRRSAPAPREDSVARPHELPRGQKEPRSSRGEGEHGNRSNGAHRSQVKEHANGGSYERGNMPAGKQETRKPKLKSRVIAPE
ncbi:g5100 [Coccomyxa viridis]|uniref:G5100 protein n=1 Tax=Coccomyxa viridis TaxID=1274662 RepID=A0ABP1FRZ3_9CHLO